MVVTESCSPVLESTNNSGSIDIVHWSELWGADSKQTDPDQSAVELYPSTSSGLSNYEPIGLIHRSYHP